MRESMKKNAKNIGIIILFLASCNAQTVFGALLLQSNTLYMHSFDSFNSELYAVNSNDGSATLVGDLATQCTDIAFAGSKLYGISFTNFFLIDPTTGAVSDVVLHGYNDLNALTAANPRILYAAGNSVNFNKRGRNVGANFIMFKFNNKTNSWRAKRIGNFGSGLTSAGDLIYFKKTLYATVNNPSSINTWLAKINPKTGKAKLIGDIGFRNVWGLAVKDKVMYAVTVDGELLQINPKNGLGVFIGSNGISQGGLTKSP